MLSGGSRCDVFGPKFGFGIRFIATGALQWLQIPAGSFLDWVIERPVLRLLTIVTVPDDILAAGSLAEAALSAGEGGIAVG